MRNISYSVVFLRWLSTTRGVAYQRFSFVFVLLFFSQKKIFGVLFVRSKPGIRTVLFFLCLDFFTISSMYDIFCIDFGQLKFGLRLDIFCFCCIFRISAASYT